MGREENLTLGDLAFYDFIGGLYNPLETMSVIPHIQEDDQVVSFFRFFIEKLNLLGNQELLAFAYSSKIWPQDLRKVPNFIVSKTLKLYDQKILPEDLLCPW